MTAYGGEMKYEVQVLMEGWQKDVWLKTNVVLLGEEGLVTASFIKATNEHRNDQPFRFELNVVEVFQFGSI